VAGEDLSALIVPELRKICKQQQLPSTGNKATLLERLNREVLRDASSEDSALKVSPVKGDDRAETCPCCGGADSPDHQCGAASLELQDAELVASQLIKAPPSEVEEEPYQLDVVCQKNGKHDRFCCCCEVQGEKFPIPPPPRVHHPTMGIGLFSAEDSERNSSCYVFLYNGEEHLVECFVYQ
jgi:hypothetical protein